MAVDANTPPATEQELKDYAEELVLDHARDVELLCIFECAKDFLGHEIGNDDAKAIGQLIRKATVTVEFPTSSE